MNILNKVKNITLRSILIALPLGGVGGGLLSCSELEDKDHYGNINTTINSDELIVVNQTSQEYIASQTQYSSMNKLFEARGIYDTLNIKGQLSTILVVENSKYVEPTGTDKEIRNKVKAHVSDAAISPANLKTENNDMRIMMWHGKYVNVNLDSAAMYQGKIADHIMFNTSAVKKVIKTNSGYIYELSNMIETPQSLNDYIEALDDNYSILRDTIKASGGKTFDKANSKAIGINEEGNTVYDSVWVYTNDHFSEKGVDLTSESLTATMLVADNNVIEAAIQDAKDRLVKWGLYDTWVADRQYDFEYTMRHWIMDAVFFNKKYTAEELQNPDTTNLLVSIFGNYWKTSKQKIYTKADTLSNGVAYKIKELHIPNNVLIWRLKEYFDVYEKCDADQKSKYFSWTNMKYSKVNVDVAGWTPYESVWPLHENRVLIMAPETSGSTDLWQFDFIPLKRQYAQIMSPRQMAKWGLMNSSLDIESIEPFLIPPGKYRFAIGFKQNMGMDISVKVLAKGDKDVTYKEIGQSSPMTIGSATTYHYDRGATLKNTYPEGYDTSDSHITNSKKSNYDTDGGPVTGLEELVVPDLNGDNSAVMVKFSFASDSWNGKNSMYFHHWCLRPTSDNY